jgi:aminoglycoside phosphotransferase
MDRDAPNCIVAGDLAAAAVGERPVNVRRFRTGSHHYVFEATFAARAPVVVRIAAEHSREAMAGALELSHRLRPLGVPLPEVIAAGTDRRFAHLVLERLPGTDLGNVIQSLSDSSLAYVASRVAGAQRITATTASVGRYGYSLTPRGAPHACWSQVLDDNLSRSRKRIAAAGLFDQSVVDTVAGMVSVSRAELDSLPAIPFLHDTTTKNVIVTPAGKFSGIVDVDDLCFGDPRYVVALTLACLKAFGGSTRYIDAWMSFAHYQSDRLFQLYVALFLVDFMSEQGQAFNDNTPTFSGDRRTRLIQAFREQLSLLDEH